MKRNDLESRIRDILLAKISRLQEDLLDRVSSLASEIDFLLVDYGGIEGINEDGIDLDQFITDYIDSVEDIL